jgi:hypothetical protein
MAADFAPLLTTMTELVSDERLVGPIEDFCLLVPEFLVESWRKVAPLQRVDSLDRAPDYSHVIVFEANDHAQALLAALQTERPPGTAIGFYSEYYPGILTSVSGPLKVTSEPIGRGLVMLHTPRTGSHYIQGMITSLGIFGKMEDWTRPPVIEAVKLGIVNIAEHFYRCARYQRSGAAHWSTRIEIPFLRSIWPLLPSSQQIELRSFLRDSHCFLLTRRDRAAQTWSTIKAVASSEWMVTHPQSNPRPATDIPVPVDQLWFWLFSNVETIQANERFASVLTGIGISEVTTVAYEDVSVAQIPEAIQHDVLGDYFEPGVTYLDPGATRYYRQATDADRPAIGRLAHLFESSRQWDLRNKSDLNQTPIHLVAGSQALRDDGVHLIGMEAALLFKISDWPKSGLIVLHFRIKEEAQNFPIVLLGNGEVNWFIHKMSRRGVYALVIDAGCIGDEPLRFGIENMQPTTSEHEPWPIAVRNLRWVDVSFDMAPYFPWIEEVTSTRHARLYRFS